MQRNVMPREGKPYAAAQMGASRPAPERAGIGDGLSSCRTAGHRRGGHPGQMAVTAAFTWAAPAVLPQNGNRNGKGAPAMNRPPAGIPVVKLRDPIADIFVDCAPEQPARRTSRTAACGSPMVSYGVAGLPLGNTRTENRSTGCDHG